MTCPRVAADSSVPRSGHTPVLVSQSPRSRRPHPAPPTQHKTRHAQPRSSGACSPHPRAPQAREHTPGGRGSGEGRPPGLSAATASLPPAALGNHFRLAERLGRRAPRQAPPMPAGAQAARPNPGRRGRQAARGTAGLTPTSPVFHPCPPPVPGPTSRFACRAPESPRAEAAPQASLSSVALTCF